jgi:isoquinoline 1-oxidoreductase beta subunit
MNRRNFLRTGVTAAGGLWLGFQLPKGRRASAAGAQKLSAWVHVGADDQVTLFIHKSEMGQGTETSLAMLLAEELECDWKKVRTEFAPVDRAYGGNQGVFGSQSVRTSWNTLRQAGAAAREMLMQAAAQQWNADRGQLRAENSFVVNTATNARVSYGSLAEAASKLTAPTNVPLKDPKQFHLIGTSPKRRDTPGKVNGTAQFGLDVRLPGMQYAVIERCPVFGGKVASFDATKAKAVPGVKQVLQVATGVAVVADNTWSAMEGRRALQITWDEGPNASQSSANIRRMMIDVASKPGPVAHNTGDADAALAAASNKIEAIYEAPYLSHAPMEPMNCVADVRADSCDIYASTQTQSGCRADAARAAGLPPEKVQVHTMYLGGGFGRRARSDYAGEAAEISKAIGAPVKLTWSREDDMQHDAYRPAAYSRFAGTLDPDGWPSTYWARMACCPFGGIRGGTPTVDRTGVEGVADMLYAIPNFRVESVSVDAGIPVSYWRSVGYSQNTFFGESFLDELAAAGKKDPLEVRRRLLAKSPRLLGALELCAGKAGWGKPLPAGHFHGVALNNNIGSFTAQIAEVSVTKGKLKVHRVVCAVDCGQVVNPAGVAQQIESGVIYGLAAALKGAITIDKGRVQQGNFHQYDVLRIDESPASIEVHMVPSTAAPGGIGEASTPGIAPAVTNAIFAATGKRIRKLPIRPEDLA